MISQLVTVLTYWSRCVPHLHCTVLLPTHRCSDPQRMLLLRVLAALSAESPAVVRAAQKTIQPLLTPLLHGGQVDDLIIG